MIQDQSGLGAVRRSRRRRPGVAATQRRTIPFDYAFRYRLDGIPGATQMGKVEVSVESVFTAVSIGYGVVPEVTPVIFGVAPKAALDAADTQVGFLAATNDLSASKSRVTGQFSQMVGAMAEALGEGIRNVNGTPVLGPATALALKNGFKLNPAMAEAFLGGGTRAAELSVLRQAFQVVAAPPDVVQFKYAIFDDATGREFQSEPILNLAGLGAPDGGRPFRYFARPIEFGPRSVIRMQIIEVSDFRGELHISLQGYKVLGGAGTPTGRLG
jgi:hypothetical protein